MSEPPQAFLFDLDGVVRIRDHERTAAIEARFGVPAGRLDELAHVPDRYGPALLGRITDEEWRTSVVVALVPVVGDVSRAIECVADWSEHVGRVDEDAAALIAELRAGGTPVALVANGTTALELYLVALGLAESFDAIVNSARAGVAKPDAEIYSLAAGILGASPERCVYVGAQAAYVAGAERLGMKGHLYDGTSGLRVMLESLPAG